MTNEAFARVKIDQLLRDTGWKLTDGRSVRYEYPLDEQRRIVGLLDRAAEIRRRAESARAIIPALFLSTFGDPASNPKGWRIGPFGEGVTEIDFGISAPYQGAPNGHLKKFQ